MPYFLIQSMSTVLFQQIYTTDDIVYNSGDSNCDHLYFVFGGKLKVEAIVDIVQENRYPIANQRWKVEKNEYLVSYLVKEISEGDVFGLEELHQIATMKLNGKNKETSKVKRLLRVTATQNSKLLYLTS